MKLPGNMKITIIACLITVIGLTFYLPLIATPSFEPVFMPSLEIRRTSEIAKIDGIINDPIWKTAGRVDKFVERQPGKNLEPEVRTEAYMTYDDENLYVAFNCFDEPSKLRATMCQRDQFSGNDVVMLLLDTYGNASWAYEFFVNPYGVQKDLLWSSIHGDDSGFDLIWESAATITDSGYQVEMAIPFASLRFPNKDVQSWRMDLYRNHPRETFKQYSWAAYDQDEQCWPCQWGTVSGIASVKPGKGMEIMPTIIGSQAGSLPNYDLGRKWDNADAEAEASIGGKYSISSDITLEAAYNPDFSQIEADAAQIDVNSTVSLMFPERRPFFQEGRDIFQTLFNSFYTRTVNDPQFAAKLTGRLNYYNIGFLSAYDKNTPYIVPLEEKSNMVNTGKSFVNVLRADRSFSDNNRLGMIVTDRRFDGGGYGTILGIDGDLRLSQKYSAVGQYIMSLTEEPDNSILSAEIDDTTFNNGKYTAALDGESYSGGAIITQFRRRARNWNFTVDYNHVAPSYRTETGYDPWVDYRNFSIWNGLNFYPENGIFERISPQIWFDNRWNYDGDKKWTHLDIAVNGDFRWAQTYLGISYMASSEQWGGVDFNDLWDLELDAGSQFSNAIGYDAYLCFGTDVAKWLLEKGNTLSIGISLDLKPFDRLTIEPSINFSKSENIDTDEEQYKQFIGRTRFQLQANKELSIRLVIQYNDSWDNWDIDPLLTYRISPFSVFYVGSTHDITELTGEPNDRKVWKQTSQQFFMKLQYLFRI